MRRPARFSTIMVGFLAAIASSSMAAAPQLITPASSGRGVVPDHVDSVATQTAWTFTYPGLGTEFGTSVSLAGDVNGDGYGDVIVGAPYANNSASNQGAAFVFMGQAGGGLSNTYQWQAQPGVAGAQFGRSVSTAGDVNGDGYDDVIVGAPSYQNNGAAFVYLGSAAGLSASPAWSYVCPVSPAAFGYSVASAGDFNGDGFGDVIVGAYQYAGFGAAFVFLGSASGLASTPSLRVVGNQVQESLGQSVAGAGDFNGDGYSDVVIGSPFYSNAFTWDGAASLYRGSASGSDSVRAWTFYGSGNHFFLGSGVAGVGDLNGDGYADVAITDPGDTDAGAIGSVRVVVGAASGATMLPTTITGSGSVTAFTPVAVASAGDLNGDGFADLVVGAPNNIFAGQILIRQGGPLSQAMEAQNLFGNSFSVSTAGDVNGDGFSDLIGGSPGSGIDSSRVTLYLGHGEMPRYANRWTYQGLDFEALGTTVSGASDVNGDGYDDFVASAPAHPILYSESSRVLGFYGGPNGPGAAPSWSLTSTWFDHLTSWGLGDVDGDGYGDVIVIHYGVSADIHRGGPMGLESSPAWQIDSTSTFLPHISMRLGDVNGDGFADVLVAQDPRYFVGGGIRVYHGSATGPHLAWQSANDTTNGYFLRTASGDFNKDGFTDLTLGHPGANAGGVARGLVLVFFGSASGLSPDPGLGFAGTSGEKWGTQVTAGDFNGDGSSELLLPAASQTGGYYPHYLWHIGPGPSASTGQIFTTQGLGNKHANAGDVDRDGVEDLAVGYPNGIGGAGGGGPQVRLFRGSPSYFNAPSYSWAGIDSVSLSRFGFDVANAGDVNGDGFPDLLVGAPGYNEGPPGKIVLLYGGGGPGRPRPVRQGGGGGGVPNRWMTQSRPPATIDAGTLHLHAQATSASGRTRVRIACEVKPAAQPFDGQGLQRGNWFDTGAPQAGGSSVALESIVSGLTPGSNYHWRLFVESMSAAQRRTPWLQFVDEGTGTQGSAVHIPSGNSGVLGPIAGGLLVFETPYPNPTRGTAQLRITMPARGSAELVIYDLAGRRQATLASGPLEAGAHVFLWNALGVGGRRVKSGVYFARLVVGGRFMTRRFTILK